MLTCEEFAGKRLRSYLTADFGERTLDNKVKDHGFVIKNQPASVSTVSQTLILVIIHRLLLLQMCSIYTDHQGANVNSMSLKFMHCISGVVQGFRS